MIHYRLTQDDFFTLQKNFIKNSVPDKRRSILVTLVLMSLTAFYGFALAIVLLPQTLSAPVILALAVSAAVVPALLLFPLFKKVYFTMRLRQLRSILRQDSKWPRDVTLLIHENGIEVNSLHNAVNKRVQVAWEAIERVNEDETHHYIFIEAAEAIIVPKQNQMLNETERIQMNDLLQKHLGIRL